MSLCCLPILFSISADPTGGKECANYMFSVVNFYPHFVLLIPTCLTPVVLPCRNVRLPSFISRLPIDVFCLSEGSKRFPQKPQF